MAPPAGLPYLPALIQANICTPYDCQHSCGGTQASLPAAQSACCKSALLLRCFLLHLVFTEGHSAALQAGPAGSWAS